MRHLVVKAVALAVSAAAAIAPAAAQEKYPSQPVELINSAGPGGGTDIFLRLLAARSSEALGAPLTVLSKTGGRAVVMMNYVNNRPRDGYTVFALTPGHLLTVAQGKAPFKFEDIVPIAVGTDDPIVLVTKADGFADAAAMIAAGKNRAVRFGGVEVGTNEWMAAVALARKADMTKPIYVPFKSGGDVLLNVIGGNVEVGVANLTEVQDQVQAGQLKPLLVLASKRPQSMPDVPTTADLGYDLFMSQARGLAVLKGTPPERVAALEKAFMTGMQSPQFQDYLKSAGLGPESVGDAEEWGRRIADISKVMQEMASELGAN